MRHLGRESFWVLTSTCGLSSGGGGLGVYGSRGLGFRGLGFSKGIGDWGNVLQAHGNGGSPVSPE